MRIFCRLLLPMLLFATGFVSCGEKAKIKKTMEVFMASHIVFPNNLQCIYNNQVSQIQIDSLKSRKLVVYYDSLDCSSCRVSHLMDIYPLYGMSDTCDFSVITIFSPRERDLTELMIQIKVLNPSIPIYIDVDGSFRWQNQCIPNDKRFNTFLLDENNIPIFIGNPLASKKLKELFRRVLDNQIH